MNIYIYKKFTQKRAFSFALDRIVNIKLFFNKNNI